MSASARLPRTAFVPAQDQLHGCRTPNEPGGHTQGWQSGAGDDVHSILTRMEGWPLANELVGGAVVSASMADRFLTIITSVHQILFDLQRNGKFYVAGCRGSYVMAHAPPGLW